MGRVMKIARGRIVAEIISGNDDEARQSEDLWKVVVVFAVSSKKLLPTGVYIPTRTKLARSAIERQTFPSLPQPMIIFTGKGWSGTNRNA